MKQKMTTLQTVTYICVCTIGTGILSSAKELRQKSLNNNLLINAIMIFVYGILMGFSMCYAELREIFHEEGGDMFYIGKFYSNLLGTFYSLSILLVSGPGVNVIFMMYLKESFCIPDKYKLLYFTLMCFAVAPLCLLSEKVKGKVVGILGMVQKVILVFIALSLPFAYIFRDKNPLVKINETVIQHPITADSFFRTLSEVYFIYGGFNEENSYRREKTGMLFKTYFISTTVIFLIYTVIVNLFLLVYKNDNSDIEYRNVLGYMGTSAFSFGSIIYYVIVGVMYILPFFGMSFMINNNISYIAKKYKIHESIKYVFTVLGALIAFTMTFFDFSVVMNIVCACMIFFSMLSMAGILIYKHRNKFYKMKVPLPIVYFSIAMAATMLGVNITYMFL